MKIDIMFVSKKKIIQRKNSFREELTLNSTLNLMIEVSLLCNNVCWKDEIFSCKHRSRKIIAILLII